MVDINPVKAGGPTSYKIDKPTLADLPQLLQLWEEQDKFHNQLDPDYYVPYETRRTEIEGEFPKLIQEDDPHIFVAREGDKVVGFINFGKEHEPYSDTKIKEFGELKELIVTEASQNKGIGAALITAVEDYFREQGILDMKIQCSSFNKTALALYEKRGYISRQVLLFKRLT